MESMTHVAVGMGDVNDHGTQAKNPMMMDLETTGDCFLDKMTWKKDLKGYSGDLHSVQCYMARDRCQFKRDEGSPVILVNNGGRAVCIYAVFNAHNHKCYHANGRLIHAKIEYYQLKTFQSKCDHKNVTEKEKHAQKLLFDEFIDIEEFDREYQQRRNIK
ncbi:uncharacterized protein LOC142353558 [Convolutriloba macropyga]|uniref:uncharacterized protein LOC142353558 n=1 Tax=Convolutriloba macropyga TaxID=536237 RepID=UPI003F51CF0C